MMRLLHNQDDFPLIAYFSTLASLRKDTKGGLTVIQSALFKQILSTFFISNISERHCGPKED